VIDALDGLIHDVATNVGIERACRALGVNPRSYRHRQQRNQGRGRIRSRAARNIAKVIPIDTTTDAAVTPTEPAAASMTESAAFTEIRRHPASLTMDERSVILDLLCSERFVDLSPRQVFTTLLDEGKYYCSVRSMYRLLEDHGLGGERRRGAHQRPGSYKVPIIEATRPNVAWSWDITKLRGPNKGVLYYLYTILDIFSRKVVGWNIALREGATIAEDLIRDAVIREGIEHHQLTLHADRGGPMIAGGVAELLLGLGVTKSHSRPRVSNDNPYSEAQFKTLKYRPDYPDRFESPHAAYEWCKSFFAWYNTVHYHSGIGYLRPADLHADRHPEILQKRRVVLDHARMMHPARFTKRPALAQPPERAWINKPSIQTS
jgi:putative transposase